MSTEHHEHDPKDPDWPHTSQNEPPGPDADADADDEHGSGDGKTDADKAREREDEAVREGHETPA